MEHKEPEKEKVTVRNKHTLEKEKKNFKWITKHLTKEMLHSFPSLELRGQHSGAVINKVASFEPADWLGSFACSPHACLGFL